MFTFHDKKEFNGDGNILTLTLSGAIAAEYHPKLDIEHCNFASDIVWGDENLCATVYSMSASLALFLIKNKDKFNVDEVVVVSNKETDVNEIGLLDGKHMDPLEFLLLLAGDEQSDSDAGGQSGGDNDFSED